MVRRGDIEPRRRSGGLRRASVEFGGLTAANALLLGVFLIAGRRAGLGPAEAVVAAHGLCAVVSYSLCRAVVWPVARASVGAELRRGAIFLAGAGAAAGAAIAATATFSSHGSGGFLLLNYTAVGLVSIAKFGVQRSAMLAVEATP